MKLAVCHRFIISVEMIKSNHNSRHDQKRRLYLILFSVLFFINVLFVSSFICARFLNKCKKSVYLINETPKKKRRENNDVDDGDDGGDDDDDGSNNRLFSPIICIIIVAHARTDFNK